MKTCSLCKQTKPLSDFSPRSGGRVKSHCKQCRREHHDPVKHREAYQKRREHILVGVQARRRRYRTDALLHYSNGTMQCACPGCTETRLEFLTLDHIDGGGNKDRRRLTKSANRNPGGLAVYYDLRRRNYPTGFRVLCFNCNSARGAWGYCPHEIAATGGECSTEFIALQSGTAGQRVRVLILGMTNGEKELFGHRISKRWPLAQVIRSYYCERADIAGYDKFVEQLKQDEPQFATRFLGCKPT